MFDVIALDAFYERVSAIEGIEIAQMEAELQELFKQPRSETDLNEFRLAKGRWKKLNDEIGPVRTFLTSGGYTEGRVRFPLDDKVPDCWLWINGASEPIGVEVTLAQGTERYHLMKELVKSGEAPGFIGLPDSTHPAVFNYAITRGRVMYSSDQAIKSTKTGILTRFKDKDKITYTGMILIVQAPLGSISEDRWTPMFDELKGPAAELPFSEVYVVGNRDTGPQSVRLK
jgi:hypothetical protein